MIKKLWILLSGMFIGMALFFFKKGGDANVKKMVDNFSSLSDADKVRILLQSIRTK